jgi:tetratricopeptide (TPR) repeat protein
LIASTAKDSYDHDALSLAKSYIEVSQLDDAIEILEQAILENPGRMELHDELLPLYRQTRNSIRFKKFFQELISQNINLPPSWNELHDYFENL